MTLQCRDGFKTRLYPIHIYETALKIIEILSEKHIIDKDTLHYINSTFNPASLDSLKKIMNNHSDPEVCSLLELIFYPTLKIQIRLETALENNIYTHEDEKILQEYIVSKNIETKIYPPDNMKSFHFLIPDFTKTVFIERLNITKQTDRQLIDTINNFTEKPAANLLKVKSRNINKKLDKKGVSFLCNFIKKNDFNTTSSIKGFDFILNFLAQIKPQDDILESLLKKKKRYLQAIIKFENINKMLKKSNMESLVLQGIKITSINRNEILDKIDHIDRILLSVFGIYL